MVKDAGDKGRQMLGSAFLFPRYHSLTERVPDAMRAFSGRGGIKRQPTPDIGPNEKKRQCSYGIEGGRQDQYAKGIGGHDMLDATVRFGQSGQFAGSLGRSGRKKFVYALQLQASGFTD